MYVGRILDAFQRALQRETGNNDPATSLKLAFLQDSEHPAYNFAWVLLVTNGGENYFVMKKGNFVYGAEVEEASDVTHKATLSGQMYEKQNAQWIEYIMEGNDLTFVNVNNSEFLEIENAIANLHGYKMDWQLLTYE